MRSSTHRRNLIAWAVALCLLSSCQGTRSFLRDPGGDDRIFAGDPRVFVGKEVIVQFRWGDRRLYGQAIPCLVLGVDDDAIVVRRLHSDTLRMDQYSKLRQLDKLFPVEGQPDVFRIRRTDISRIFESAAVRPTE
jgi:hypothetical protein